MVGSVIAKELSKKHSVSCADINKDAVKKLSGSKVIPVLCDLSDEKKIKSLVSDYDLVIGAVPGFLGFQMMKAVVSAKKILLTFLFLMKTRFKWIRWRKKIISLLLWIAASLPE